MVIDRPESNKINILWDFYSTISIPHGRLKPIEKGLCAQPPKTFPIRGRSEAENFSTERGNKNHFNFHRRRKPDVQTKAIFMESLK